MSNPVPTPVLADGNIETNAEPQLKFEALHGDLDSILQDETISCLCLSDKILTLGTEEGRVHVLDYCGNQARVNELSIDAAEEYVASCSDDGSVFVMGLCGDLSLKHEHFKPVKAIAIDPRFAARKTKEFVAINEAGVVQLSTQVRCFYEVGAMQLNAAQHPGMLLHEVSQQSMRLTWCSAAHPDTLLDGIGSQRGWRGAPQHPDTLSYGISWRSKRLAWCNAAP
ncbi:hypothetical protein DUNSADRAFT_6376 [Dunaliella salina]|uniref:Vps41 beta-propeller domain-containing protein n=1 Tax=Dunaliella salina TaxID=3046 RepID=A0ABQ7GND3_DUNSA|nr:hypothetical protein DUNSADRAFT_6376 [Dunaliella salina]|eukprot:KAF5836123.1 hypothetical protein DUNSADRAFT_6376 [Dunaliella salina]